MRRPVEQELIRADLRALHWIGFDEDARFPAQLRELIETLDDDFSGPAESTGYAWLEVRAADWEGNQGERSRLLRGRDLKQSLTLIARAREQESVPSQTARDYVAASAVARRRRRQTLQAISAAVLAIVIGAGTFAGIEFSGKKQSNQQALAASIATAAAAAAATDPSLAARLDVAANKADPRADSESQLLSAAIAPLSSKLTGPPGGISSVAFSPNGKVLAAGAGGKVWLWSLADPGPPVPLGSPLSGPKADIDSLAFSPGGTTLAVSSGDAIWRWRFANPAHPGRPAFLTPLLTGPARPFGTVAFSGQTLIAADSDNAIWRWDVADPAHPVPLGVPLPGPKEIFSLAVSPAGNVMAAAGGDGTVWLWSLADPAVPVRLGAAPLTGPVGGAYSVAFSPDGRSLAVGGHDSKVWLWDVTDPAHAKQLTTLIGPTNIVGSVAFSADGTMLAATSGDDRAWLWNFADPSQPVPFGSSLTGPETGVSAAVFSPGAPMLATATAFGAVRLWSLPGNVLTGPGGLVTSLAYSQHRDVLAAGGNNGTVWLWDRSHPRRLGLVLSDVKSSVGSVALSADGRLLAAETPGKVWLWDIADLARPVQFPPQALAGATAQTLAFSPDGKTLAVGGETGRKTQGAAAGITGEVWLWNVANPAHPVRYKRALPGPAISVLSVAFSQTGNLLAYAGVSPAVWLWNVANPASPVPLGTVNDQAEYVPSVAVSPDGQFLAAVDGMEIRLWRLADPRHPVALTPLTGPVKLLSSVTFAPSGKTLAAGTTDGAAWLWGLAGPGQPVQLGNPLTGPAASVSSLAFAPDSSTLAAAGTNGTVQLWSLDVDAAVARICATTGGALTQPQWGHDFHGVPYTSPCADPGRYGYLKP